MVELAWEVTLYILCWFAMMGYAGLSVISVLTIIHYCILWLKRGEYLKGFLGLCISSLITIMLLFIGILLTGYIVEWGVQLQ